MLLSPKEMKLTHPPSKGGLGGATMNWFHHNCGTTICPGLSEIDGGVRWRLNHVRSNFGELLPNPKDRASLYSPKFSASGRRPNHVGFDFGLPSLVTFFGGAKKVTALFTALPEACVHLLNLRDSGDTLIMPEPCLPNLRKRTP